MTQIQLIKRHLTDHGSISSMEAFTEYGITRLADVIYKIKRQCGWTIITDTNTAINRYGTKVTYGVYRRVDAHPFNMIEKLS